MVYLVNLMSIIYKTLGVFALALVLGVLVAALIGAAFEEADASRQGISLDDGAITGRTR